MQSLLLSIVGQQPSLAGWQFGKIVEFLLPFVWKLLFHVWIILNICLMSSKMSFTGYGIIYLTTIKKIKRSVISPRIAPFRTLEFSTTSISFLSEFFLSDVMLVEIVRLNMHFAVKTYWLQWRQQLYIWVCRGTEGTQCSAYTF